MRPTRNEKKTVNRVFGLLCGGPKNRTKIKKNPKKTGLGTGAGMTKWPAARKGDMVAGPLASTQKLETEKGGKKTNPSRTRGEQMAAASIRESVKWNVVVTKCVGARTP